MFLTKLGAKVYQGSKSIINILTRNKSLKNMGTQSADSCGLALKTLETDTVQIANKVKQPVTEVIQPTIKTAPAVFEGSQVPMHHNIHGGNIRIHEVSKDIISPDPEDIEYAKHVLSYMHKVDKEFAKLPPIEKDCIVWRGRCEHFIKRWNTDFEIIEHAKVGDVIIPDTGYSYTGFTRELAECWGRPAEGKSIMYKIKLPKGAKVSRNLEHGGEVVMPRNAEYRVLSKTTNGSRTEVELEYILPTKDNVTEIEELMRKFNIDF